MSLAANLFIAIAYHLLMLLALVLLIAVCLRGYERREARLTARERCPLCSEPECDGTRQRCVERWR